jgi:hypothetical protein
MKLIDNVLDTSDFEQLQTLVMSSNFPWYFAESIDYGEGGWHLSHLIINNGESTSPYSDFITKLLIKAVEKTGSKVKQIIRARAFLLVNVKLEQIPHIDGAFNHDAGILYLNDSDGTTKLLNHSYDPFSIMTGREYYENFVKDKYTIQQEVEPKSNRLLTFNGMTYHIGSNPVVNNKRYIVNFNYSVED